MFIESERFRGKPQEGKGPIREARKRGRIGGVPREKNDEGGPRGEVQLLWKP